MNGWPILWGHFFRLKFDSPGYDKAYDLYNIPVKLHLQSYSPCLYDGILVRWWVNYSNRKNPSKNRQSIGLRESMEIHALVWKTYRDCPARPKLIALWQTGAFMVQNIHESIENYKDLKTTPEKVISACPERYVKDKCVLLITPARQPLILKVFWKYFIRITSDRISLNKSTDHDGIHHPLLKNLALVIVKSIALFLMYSEMCHSDRM